MTVEHRRAEPLKSSDVKVGLSTRWQAWDRWLLVIAPGIIAIVVLYLWPLVVMTSRGFSEPPVSITAS